MQPSDLNISACRINARRDWERRAAPIAAYREIYGYDHLGLPIGPEPGHQARPARRLARGVRRPRPGSRARRPGHVRRPTVAAPRHLRHPERLGTPSRRKELLSEPL